MHIRKLRESDAVKMIEWMHDKSVVENLKGDFISKTIDDCKSFIKNAINGNNCHLAIADRSDAYMGTVSLKNNDRQSGSAEFAIVVSRAAMGKGYGIFAMKHIIKKAFEDYGLSRVYWCVDRSNERALKFYDKNGYRRVDDMEKLRDIPFRIKRVYYMYDTADQVVRGHHAHKNLEQILVCIHGSCKVKLDNGNETKVVPLEKPYEGLYVASNIWREMFDFSPDAVLLVFASELYDEADYIRDYNEFIEFSKNKE